MTTENNQILSKELENLRGSKGSGLRFADIEMLIQAMANSAAVNDPNNSAISSELSSVQEEIKSLKQNLCEISTEESCDTYDMLVSSINDLRDVFKIQEASTNEILDASEQIMSLMGAESPNKQAVTDAAIKICEKCNFQDLSGQRLQRVLNNLSKLEYVICTVLKVFMGIQVQQHSLKNKQDSANDDRHLMNGPQSLNKAPSQEDIDKLFA